METGYIHVCETIEIILIVCHIILPNNKFPNDYYQFIKDTG